MKILRRKGSDIYRMATTPKGLTDTGTHVPAVVLSALQVVTSFNPHHNHMLGSIITPHFQGKLRHREVKSWPREYYWDLCLSKPLPVAEQTGSLCLVPLHR